jgi:hypothetical protein
MTTAVDTIFFLLVAIGRERLRVLAPALPAFLTTLARDGRGGRRTFDDWLRGVVVGRAFALDEEAVQALCATASQVVVAGMLRPNPVLLDDYLRVLVEQGSLLAIEAVTVYKEPAELKRGAQHPFAVSTGRPRRRQSCRKRAVRSVTRYCSCRRRWTCSASAIPSCAPRSAPPSPTPSANGSIMSMRVRS